VKSQNEKLAKNTEIKTDTPLIVQNITDGIYKEVKIRCVRATV